MLRREAGKNTPPPANAYRAWFLKERLYRANSTCYNRKTMVYNKRELLDGFTLAEVLITLGIIGVVAALTMPVIIKGKERKELETGFKKQYSVLQNAFTRLNHDKGEVYVRDNSRGTRKFKSEFITYFNVLSDCKFEDCSKINGKSIYKDLTNKYDMYQTYIDDGQFITTDGALFMLNDATDEPFLASFDVNGPKKGPNRLGYDVFVFQLMNNGKLPPMGAEGTWFTDEKYCNTSKPDMRSGLTCAYKALENADYFKKLP